MSVATQSETRVVDRILAFTRDVIEREAQDHAFNHSPLLAAITGRILGDGFGGESAGAMRQTQTGGESIVIRMNLGKNAGVKRKSGPWDTNNNAPSDTVRFSRANWKLYTVPVVLADHELQVNTGDSAIASLLQNETTNAMRSVADTVGDDLYQNNGNSSAVSCLADLVGIGTVQGLNPTTYPVFASRGVTARGTATASITFAGGSFATTGISNWRLAFNNASEGMIKPNFIVTDWATYAYYEGQLQPQEQFVDTRIGDAGFENFRFKTAPVMADDKCPSGITYFLNTEYLKFYVLSGADFDLGEFERVTDQSARIAQISVTGNLCVLNRKYLNKVTGQTA